MPASSAYGMLQTALLEVLLEVNQIPYDLWVLPEAYQHGVDHSSS